MDINLARHVVRASFRSGRELEGLLGVLKEHCSASEYKTYATAIATAVASIHLEIVNRITSGHPGLEDEIEATISKYGRYL
jgi:hypothetical protein